jgi:kinesin family member C1
MQVMERKLLDQLKGLVDEATGEHNGLKTSAEEHKQRGRFKSVLVIVHYANPYVAIAAELQQTCEEYRKRISELESQLRRSKEESDGLKRQLDEQAWKHRTETDQMQRSAHHTSEDLKRSFDDEIEKMRRGHREELEALRRHCDAELEDERRLKSRELQDLRDRMGSEKQDLHLDTQRKEREINDMRGQLESLKGDLDREATLRSNLQASLTEMAAANLKMEATGNSLHSRILFLESDSKAQSDSYVDMEARLQDANRRAEEAQKKLIKEETERRVLFNKYQELKGNIRVMCRVRPVLDATEGDAANLSFPDEKTSATIDVQGPEEKSALGVVSRRRFPFDFDRVFDTGIQNEEIFGEISQLVQSTLDGYNVCIFCYGQTGSGKTYTMSAEDGMIPRATHMIYDTITKLKEKSWTYTMVGSFIEVYNEDLYDLLTPNSRDDGRKKLQIKHDEASKTTTVTNCKTVCLDSPDKVENMLSEAQKNRSVAATKANERSSRSHSVFVLRLVGENSATGERCEGTLNLVDLAGSERVKHSGAEGDRMKEAQSINKSLSCLGDVIDALGKNSAHVPYRNSKLTHLLQYSLGGNSKTLMFVMVSPLEAHLNETLSSLRFAAKVRLARFVMLERWLGSRANLRRCRSTPRTSERRRRPRRSGTETARRRLARPLGKLPAMR